MRSVLVMIPFLTPAVAMAGDAAELDFLGFSEDGGYFAYAESGVQDGSGFPYCSIRAVDSSTGEVVWSTDLVLEECPDRTQDPERTAMREAKGHIFALGIRPGNHGFRAIHHPLSDLGVSPDSVVFSTINAPEPWGGAYWIVLETEVVADSAMSADWGFEPAIASLVLGDSRDGAHCPMALEAVRAGHERYTWGYRIQDVFVLDADVVVALVETFSLGFEGADVRFVSACGRISQLEK
jgi:predicted secreted protein